MTRSEARRLQLGDVIEIETSKGLAYAQYVNNHKLHGTLLRVLVGLFNLRPEDIKALVDQKERYYVFFPVNAALRAGLVKHVGTFEIPKSARAFPLMRLPGIRGEGGRPQKWWLWDGEREWETSELGESERKLSIGSILNDTLLKERIAAGWTPEDDV
jgi:hypothetical protein